MHKHEQWYKILVPVSGMEMENLDCLPWALGRRKMMTDDLD